MEFNINSEVYVKLTDAGRKEHRQSHERFSSNIFLLKEYQPPKEDSGGWSRWQLWELMSTFGHMLHNGATNIPFETTIRLDE